jgi:serine O-acetyltransferase
LGDGEFGWVVRTDVHRITGRSSWTDVLRQLITGETYAYVFWLRLCQRLARSSPSLRPALFLARLVLRRLRYRMGINLPYSTPIGPGLLIGHTGGIVVNATTVIGRNCNLSHNVTIGENKGTLAGVPRIGDNVYIGPGAVVIGDISIGNGSAIGANSVVVDNVPSGVTVAGAPARVVSDSGSAAWVNRTDYLSHQGSRTPDIAS